MLGETSAVAVGVEEILVDHGLDRGGGVLDTA
jgi:hypothetical protein